uniref:GPI ethanolamine phosphate transferase 1 n=1 Tax=Panagrellus redivivus TaxID=6233 RepID=A0A7E4VRC3_PANRE
MPLPSAISQMRFRPPSVYQLFAGIGVFVHLILLYSIFEIYYTSPLVKGTKPHPITRGVPLARRVVVFSADGLRSTSFFEHPDRSPYLHSLIRSNVATWGISKSHVPTESRPGHVAMLAGFYEDVSAVARGWKHNPVAFDSVFNQSRNAYLWGSPDILPMFVADLPGAHADFYTHEEEDFASKDAAGLDRWVFDKVSTFLTSEDGYSLPKTADRQIFFLHLLGLDTNGHGHKPRSEEYLSNIATVDAGIAEMVALFKKVFPDDSTSFVFTADHGMTDWGSHGSGTDDEILTPFIAWGAGVRSLASKQVINQVDVAPFVSALLGTAVPMNSVGVLPLSFLKAPPQYKYQAACGNLKQMVEQYNIRRLEREANSLPFLFKDFPGFKAEVLNKVLKQIVDLQVQARLDQAAQFCVEWVPKVRDALIYFHRYQRFSQGVAIAALFFTWNLALFSISARNSKLAVLELNVFVPGKPTIVFLLIGAILIAYQSLPFTNYFYFLLPIYLGSFCTRVLNLSIPTVSEALEAFERFKVATKVDLQNHATQWFYSAFLFAFPLTIFVAAFFERSVLSVMLLFLAALPYVQGNQLYPWNAIWCASATVLAVFPQFETVGKNPVPALVVVAPLVAAGILHVFVKRTSATRAFSQPLFNVLQGLLGISFLLNLLTVIFGHAFFLTKVLSWMSLPAAFVLPLFSAPYLVERLAAWLVCLFLPYSLLSLAYESLFLVMFSVLIFAYLRLEFSHLSDEQFLQLELKAVVHEQSEAITGPFTLREWKRAVVFIALIEVAFFGTGNIASLNSFNPTFLRNLISVFAPFTMAALLIIKIVLPFLSLALGVASVLHLERKPVVRFSLQLMIITDSMAAVFFFFLRDEGSWLDIGISISNYIISMATSVFVFVLLHAASRLLPADIDKLQAYFSKPKVDV